MTYQCINVQKIYNLPMILLSKNDLPVPALPVKKMFWPLSTAWKTLRCSTLRLWVTDT